MESADHDNAVSVHVASGQNWRALFLVGATLGVTQLGYYLTASALPLYLRDVGAAQNRIGLEVGLGDIAGVVGTLLLGPLLHRYGASEESRA